MNIDKVIINDELQVMNTYGDGNCAFHAILGNWYKFCPGIGYYYCQEVDYKRENMADQIKNCNDKNSELYKAIIKAIKRYIRDTNLNEISSDKLREEKEKYEKNQRSYDWRSLEKDDIFTEYADYISRNGIYLTDYDCKILALINNIKLNLYITRTDNTFVKKQGKYSPSEIGVVNIRFNGLNHFERLQETKTAKKLLQQLSLTSQSTVSPLPLSSIKHYLDFMPRPQLMAQLIKQLTDVSFAVLTGMAGAGKTKLAQRYFQQYKKNYQYSIWLSEQEKGQDGSYRAAIMKALLQQPSHISTTIQTELQQVSIFEHSTTYQQATASYSLSLEQFRKELQNRTPWLIVFDNVASYLDIQKTFFDSFNESEFINFRLKGDIVCTTRMNKPEEWGNNLIRVGFFNEKETIAYLKNTLQNTNNYEDNATVNALLNPNQSFEDEARKLDQLYLGYPVALREIVYHIKREGITLAKFNDIQRNDSLLINRENLPINLKTGFIKHDASKRLLQYCIFLNVEFIRRSNLLDIAKSDKNFNYMQFNQAFNWLIENSILVSSEYGIDNIFFLNPMLKNKLKIDLTSKDFFGLFKLVANALIKRFTKIYHTNIMPNQEENMMIWARHADSCLAQAKYLVLPPYLTFPSEDEKFLCNEFLQLIRNINKYYYYREYDLEKRTKFSKIVEQMNIMNLLSKRFGNEHSCFQQLIFSINKYALAKNKFFRDERRPSVNNDNNQNYKDDLKKTITELNDTWNYYNSFNDYLEFRKFCGLTTEQIGVFYLEEKYRYYKHTFDSKLFSSPEGSNFYIESRNKLDKNFISQHNQNRDFISIANDLYDQFDKDARKDRSKLVILRFLYKFQAQVHFTYITNCLNKLFNRAQLWKSQGLTLILPHFPFFPHELQVTNPSNLSSDYQENDININANWAASIKHLDIAVSGTISKLENKRNTDKLLTSNDNDEAINEAINRLLRLRLQISIYWLSAYIAENALILCKERPKVNIGNFDKIYVNFRKYLNICLKLRTEFFNECLIHSAYTNKYSGRVLVDLAEIIFQYLTLGFNSNSKEPVSIFSKKFKNKIMKDAYLSALTTVQDAIYLYKQSYLHKDHLFYHKAEELQKCLIQMLGFTEREIYKKFTLAPQTKDNLNIELEKLIEQIIQNPQNADLHFNIASILIALGKTDAAIAEYDKLIERNVTNIKAYRARGHLKHFQKKYDEAIQDFQHFLLLAPDDSDTRDWLKTVENERDTSAESKLVTFKKQKERFIYLIKEKFVIKVIKVCDSINGIDNRKPWPEHVQRIISAVTNLVPNFATTVKAGVGTGVTTDITGIEIRPREFIRELAAVPLSIQIEQAQYIAKKINELKDQLMDALNDIAREIAEDYEPFYLRKPYNQLDELAEGIAKRMFNHIASGKSNRTLPIKQQLKQGLFKGQRYTGSSGWCLDSKSAESIENSKNYSNDSSYKDENKTFKQVPMITIQGFIYQPPKRNLGNSCNCSSSESSISTSSNNNSSGISSLRGSFFTSSKEKEKTYPLEFRFGTDEEAEQLGFTNASNFEFENKTQEKSNEELKVGEILKQREYSNRR